MSNSISFGQLPTLSTITWSSDKFRLSWKWRDRSMESVMQRFADLNRRNLAYLGITTSVESHEGKPCIRLTTSKYIGSIPIKSPMNGKEVGDLSVTGRFGEDASELIPLLGDSVKPEYSDEFHLVQGSQLTPPIFIECCKYIDTYLEAERFKWRKFDNIVKKQQQPSSGTLWTEYAVRTAKNPLEFGIFKNKCNVLTTEHEEWAQLNYVLTLAIGELESVGVPIRIRSVYSEKISYLKSTLAGKDIKAVSKIVIRMADPYIIKQLKLLAIAILNKTSNERTAWRMDYAEFFERYVQFIFRDVAKKKGASVFQNPHFGISYGKKPSWGLSYLEPDLIIQKGIDQYVIDAKYKSHVFNWNEDSSELKDTFRHDLHQILAYCSFSQSSSKKALLVYPFSEFSIHKLNAKSHSSNRDADIYLIGLPLSKQKIDEIRLKLCDIIDL